MRDILVSQSVTEVKIVFFESHYPKAENENGNKIMICVVVKNY